MASEKKPELCELSNGAITLKVTNSGATITSLLVPDSQENGVADVVLGFNSLEPYLNGDAPYQNGPRQGRAAGRRALGAARAAARHGAHAAMEAAVAPPSSGDSPQVDLSFGQRTVKAQQ